MLPRITLFICDLGGGGAERVFVNLANGLVGRGHVVDLLAGNLKSSPYLGQVDGRVRLVELGATRLRAIIPHLVSYLRKHRPRAMISARNTSNAAAVLGVRLSGIGCATIVTVHSTVSAVLAAEPSLKNRWVERLGAWAARRANRVVAVSHGCARDYAAFARIPLARIAVIYNPIISADLLSRARESARECTSRPANDPLILAVGRLDKPKDYPTLLRAFAAVRRRHAARLIILGEGAERPAIERLVSDLGLDNDVSLPGFISETSEFFRRASVFVLSSAWEALPTVLVEALAHGCRVVSTDCQNGPREILRDGRLGRLVPVGDPHALADAILDTLNTEEHTPVCQEDLAEFTIEHATARYARLIEEELGLPRSREASGASLPNDIEPFASRGHGGHVE